MIITQSNFLNLLSGIVQYQIPIYQRYYDWDIEHCERILLDIIKAGTPGNPSHYIGSIIVKEEQGAGGVNIYNVIDGQQRATTVSLLLLALGEYFSAHPISTLSSATAAILNNLKGIYLTNSALSGTSLYSKLLLKQGTDRTEFDNLLHGVVGTGKISKNYNYFLKELTNKTYNPEIILTE